MSIRYANWRSVGVLTVAASLLTPIGAWALAVFDPDPVRRVISALVLVFAIILAVPGRE